jgi:hypothetical protein
VEGGKEGAARGCEGVRERRGLRRKFATKRLWIQRSQRREVDEKLHAQQEYRLAESGYPRCRCKWEWEDWVQRTLVGLAKCDEVVEWAHPGDFDDLHGS